MSCLFFGAESVCDCVRGVALHNVVEECKTWIGILTSDASMGNNIVAVAVFDVNSVKNVISTLIVRTIAKSEIEPKTVS